MNPKFSDIKVLVWDFDGTLYPPNPALWHEVREAEYRVIAEHCRWPREKVLTEFEQAKKNYLSATEAVAGLTHISTEQAAREMEQYYDRRKYLTRDKKLISLFSELGAFKHFMIANGVRKNIETAIKVLGLNPEIFQTIVTSELVGKNKPSLKPFRYVLNQTKLDPDQHLMIGDRVEIDLLPAKQLGMKTCLVWGKTQEAPVDLVFPTVYDILPVLTQ